MPTLPSNKIKFLLATKAISFSTDTFKIILMNSSYVFNQDTHVAYSNVSSNELLAGNGYTVGGATLSGVQVTEDLVNDRCRITWNNVTWAASGGAIGPTVGAIIYDDTVAAPVNKPIVGFIDFNAIVTQADGGVANISNIEVRLT